MSKSAKSAKAHDIPTFSSWSLCESVGCLWLRLLVYPCTVKELPGTREKAHWADQQDVWWFNDDSMIMMAPGLWAMDEFDWIRVIREETSQAQLPFEATSFVRSLAESGSLQEEATYIICAVHRCVSVWVGVYVLVFMFCRQLRHRMADSSRPFKTKVCIWCIKQCYDVMKPWWKNNLWSSLAISGHCLMPECWAIGCRYLQALRPFGGPIWRIWRVWYTNIMWWRNMENILWYDMTKYDTMRYHMMYWQHWTAPSFHGIPFSLFSAEPKIQFFPRQMALDFLCIDITCSMECCANGWTRTLVSSTRTDLDWSFLVCGLIMLNCHTSSAEWLAAKCVLLYKKNTTWCHATLQSRLWKLVLVARVATVSGSSCNKRRPWARVPCSSPQALRFANP